MDKLELDAKPTAEDDGVQTQPTAVKIERLKVRTLKKLKGGYGAASSSSETVSSDCTCSCPPA